MNIVQGFSLQNGNKVQSVTPDIVWDYDILSFENKVSMVCRTKSEAADIVKWFGHEDFMPVLPILLCIPGGWGQLAGMGLATASELRDEAVARWELQEAKIAKTGRTFDFDEAREKAGLIPFADVADAMRNAMDDRVKHHKASAVTDSGHTIVYPRWAGKTVHAVADDQAWKDN